MAKDSSSLRVTQNRSSFFSETGVAVAQEYIANAGWDARILIVGSDAFAMKRVAADGEWRTNISCGGRAELLTPPKEWVNSLIHLLVQLGPPLLALTYCLAVMDRHLYLKLMSGWQALQTVTQENISSAILNTIRRHFDSKSHISCDQLVK